MNNWNFYFYCTLIQIVTFDNLKTLQSDEIDMFYSIVGDGFEEEWHCMHLHEQPIQFLGKEWGIVQGFAGIDHILKTRFFIILLNCCCFHPPGNSKKDMHPIWSWLPAQADVDAGFKEVYFSDEKDSIGGNSGNVLEIE